MPPVYDPNCNVRDSGQRLVSPRINVSLLPTLVNVTTQPTLLPPGARKDRTFILVQNQGSAAVFLGDASVAATGITTGYQLNPFSDITIPCDDSAAIYAIGTQSTNVSVLEGV
jgi:hypothetical protein